jgi:hypothetical protein
MEAVVIEVKSKNDIKFWLNLAKKTGTRASAIDTEEIEDAKLGGLIEEGLMSDSVSSESIMDILKHK